jgi:chromosome segregation ATPase
MAESKWRIGDILKKAEHTDPSGAEVVPLRRKGFDQLAREHDRAMADKRANLEELERLKGAYAAEMERMSDLIERSNVRIRTTRDELRMLLSEIGISARFIDDDHPPTPPMEPTP